MIAENLYTYALIDARSTSIFYVGLTNDVRERFISHIMNREVNRAKNAIIDELRAVGMLPYFRLLEVSEGERAGRESERRWIGAFLELGEPLTNSERIGQRLEGLYDSVRYAKKIPFQLFPFVAR